MLGWTPCLAGARKRALRRSNHKARGLACACALGAWFAGASPAQAYKVQVSELGASVHWHASTVTLRLDPGLEAYFGDMPMAELVTDAALAWRGLDGVPELLVSRGAPAPLGFREEVETNGVYLVEDWTLWPDALAATITTFESKTGRLVDADVQVNANYAFEWSSPDGAMGDRYDLLSVMTHEMGHVLGLGDATDAPGATMWPTIAPGDTYQRDLDADDEAGVEEAYALELGDETMAGSGCGGASVLWPRSARFSRAGGLLFAAAILLAILGWFCARRMRSSRPDSRASKTAGRVIALGGVLLFGGLFSPSPASPPREPPGLSELPPATWLPREHPLARKRLAEFVHGAERLIKGRALSRSAQRHGSLIWTHFRVQGLFAAAELSCPGGSLGGFTQVVSGHVPPREGELLVVALRKKGPSGWAHFRDGFVYGGSLGAGPALEWE
jgi:Matrixin